MGRNSNSFLKYLSVILIFLCIYFYLNYSFEKENDLLLYVVSCKFKRKKNRIQMADMILFGDAFILLEKFHFQIKCSTKKKNNKTNREVHFQPNYTIQPGVL